jgi:hypothetical protein
MHTIVLDFEATYTKTINLASMSLRQYLEAADILGMAVAYDDEAVSWFTPQMPEWAEAVDLLRYFAGREDTTFVAHNAAFELRVLMHKLGLPAPRHMRCTLEGAMCAFQNHPGGYSLKNLGQTLTIGGTKAGEGTKVMKMSPAELEAYCKQDVEMTRNLYRVCERRIHPDEWRIGELCMRLRECWLHIDGAAVDSAFDGFTKLADDSAAELAVLLDDTDSCAFGRDESGHARSVKPAQVKALLLDNLGFDTRTISSKKVNPVALAQNPEAAKAVKAAGSTNRALSNKRKVGVFTGKNVIDMELGWCRAHTGRFSSPSTGKGLNLHNLSKHDPVVAKLFRSMFRLPGDLCFVRADEANVEYRTLGLLTGSPYIDGLFSGNIFADPYSAFGMSVIGRPIQKKDPIRQLFKMAVLGLSYGMGLELWVREVLKELAKPPRKGQTKADLTVDDLAAVCHENHWQFPSGKFIRNIMSKTGADPVVITAAYHTREAFHRVHPEFKQLAQWLMALCEEVSRSADPAAAVDVMYTLPTAPDRALVDCQYTDEFEGRSVKVRCGNWPTTTVVWRDLGVREVPQRGFCLTSMAGAKGYRAISPAICVENITQSAARNATCQAKLALEDRYPYLLSVHDEIMPIIPRTREAVLQCRHDLLDVLGPNKLPGWKWSILIDPREINVSSSLYEKDMSTLLPGENRTNLEWWAQLEAGDETLLDNLP